MPRLQARRRRRELEMRPDVKLTAEAYHALVLLETGDKAQADEAVRRYMLNTLLQGGVVE